MIIDTDRLMTQSEYARKIGCTAGYVTKLIKEGKVNYVRIKGSTLIVETDE